MIRQAALSKLYSLKQQEVLRWHYANDYFMLVNHGAVRTGKTFVDNDIFLSELTRIGRFAKAEGIADPQYILAGASIGALQRNVLTPIAQKYGLQIRFDKYNRFRMFGTLVCCFGHDDIGNLSAITGMTANGAYVNEGTKAKDEVLKQIVKRCSGDKGFHARILIDTNPDSPVHPIKTDYIDKADGAHIKDFHWELSDNPFLSGEYVENLKRATPTGVYTDRDVKGLWVTAEGIVYRDFDASVHIVDRLPAREQFTHYFCGVDWGYEHRGCICLFGTTGDGTAYLLREITAQHKLIDYWVDAAKELIRDYGYGIPFYCDSARPDLVQTFRNRDIWALNADKSIQAGVEAVARRLKNNELFFCRPGLCDFEKEIYNYVWDEKKGVPVKSGDDVMDAVRYAIYMHDKRREQ